MLDGLNSCGFEAPFNLTTQVLNHQRIRAGLSRLPPIFEQSALCVVAGTDPRLAFLLGGVTIIRVVMVVSFSP